jgi:hypothetical protein
MVKMAQALDKALDLLDAIGSEAERSALLDACCENQDVTWIEVRNLACTLREVATREE